MKKRLIYLSLAISCFIACVLIVKLLNENRIVRGFIGDIIVILLIYFLIKAFYDFHPLKLAVFTLMLAYITEFLQYLKLASFLGLEHNTVARLIIGSVFDPYDLVAYTVGAILVYIIDTRIVRRALSKIR